MNATAGRTTGKAAQRSMEARLGRIGREIDQIAKRVAACPADVRAKVQRPLDHLRERHSRAREHLRQQAQADQAAGEAYAAELAWDLNELDVELAIAHAALDVELAADAAIFDAAVQSELDAWNDWIGLLQAKAARQADTPDQAEALTQPLQQRSAAAASALHRFRANPTEERGQARVGVEQAMAELREAADETTRQVTRQIGDRLSRAWPVPTASQVRAARAWPVRGGAPRWLAGWGWPSPWWTVAFGVLTIAAGVVVLVWPREALTVLSIVLGIQLLVAGVFWVVSAFSVPDAGVAALVALTGVLGILVGVLLVSHPIQGIAALVLLVGLYWTVAGLVQFVHGVRGYMPARGWTIAAGVVGAAAGIVVLVYPLPSVFVLTLLFGVLLILHGAFLVAEGIRRLQWRRATVPAHP
ncbi:HdeD family acid-resistance protein [Amycolatopsis taiwanensis]|uniref:HdeD family acid-resistance protein n=1 Tax=Amycolatopsis taiwanensis TaxID=342230 RepID=UPI0004B90F0B|nr:HdeD family acid-resistance protein [Amycolatopsis taiwanensis]